MKLDFMERVSGGFIKECVLIAIIVTMGMGYRSWQKWQVKQDQNLEERRVKLQRQLEEMQRQIARLPSEHRDIIQDALAATNPGVISNPLMLQLSRMRLNLKSETGRRAETETPIQQIEKFCLWWQRTQSAIAYLLWVATGGIFVSALIGFLRNKDASVVRMAGTAVATAHYWLLALSIINALIFAANNYNPWGDLPVSFLMAPIVLGIGGVGFSWPYNLSKQTLKGFGVALTAPAASYSVLRIFSWFG